MDNLLENLNAEQSAAVAHRDGPLLIVAGAGTGKTTVVTQRIAYLVEQGLAKPDEILALTFTEKAAGEMEERVDRLLPFGYVDLWIMTFHGFGERVLKEHGLAMGLPADFRLYNEFEQWALVRKHLDRFDLDYYRPLGNPTKFISALVKHFSRAKDEDISPPEYLAFADELKENLDNMLSGSKKRKGGNIQYPISNIQDADGKPDKTILTQEINRINEIANAYHVYQQLLLDNSALDFGDLINYCLKLFRERPAILSEYRRRFKYILVDEFQDTNWAQYELVKMLAAPGNNLVVVGDDDQSVYKFRGASVANILQFKQDYPESKEIFLVNNYRNRQNILDLAYDFIQLNNPNRLECQLASIKSQVESIKHDKSEVGVKRTPSLDKRLVAAREGAGEIGVIEGADLREEVAMIAEKIAELMLKDTDAGWNDFAVLVRANESAKDVCAGLEAAGLPYLFLASRGLYAKPVILDVVAYLKLLDNYHESTAVHRILNNDLFGFTPAELVNFNYIARKKAWSLYTVLQNAGGKLGADTQAKIDTVLGHIARHSALARNRNASEVMIAFLNDSGYLARLTAADNRENMENLSYLNKFMKRVREFESANDDKSVKAFLAELAVEIEAGGEGGISPDADSGPEAIKVMTVHAAKGLEFKYVILAGLVDKRFPTIGHKEPIPLPDALVKEVLPEGDIHLEEERRLFYVALTRAKDGLFLSWAPDYGGARKKKPSRFLVEAGLVVTDRSAKSEVRSPKCEEKSAKPDARSDMFSAPGSSKFAIRNSQLKIPSYFSYTQLAAYGNCPYQYKLAHILKVPTRSRHTFSFGQTMHLTLQKLFELAVEKRGFGQTALFDVAAGPVAAVQGKTKAKFSREDMLAIYEASWIDEWYENDKQKREYHKLGMDSLNAFYNKYKDNWPNTVSLEQGINLKISGFRLFGKIDRIDELENGLQIVDYKTGNPKDPDKISPEEKEQLLIYQLAAEQVFEKKIANLQFYYLNDNSEINFLGKDKDLRNMESKLMERIGEIKTACENNDFPAKAGPLCRYCDFNGICESRKL